MKHAGLPATDPQPIDLRLERPVLAVVVDTEEEFDWSKPFDRCATGTRSIPAQDRAHAIFDRHGLVPTYVMDYPVATCHSAVAYFRRLVDAGRAEVGTHCHPWVTPPYEESVNARNSFHGNLPAELEAAKIRSSTEAVAQAFGASPTVFKAGRYGVGPATFDTLRALGYTVDCSFVPHTCFAEQYGPSFLGMPDVPFFTDQSRMLLEVPLSVGFAGPLSRMGRALPALTGSPWAQRAHLPGILSRLRVLERVRLSPEGFDLASQIRLLDAMVGQGVSVFTLTYHSPSLAPGNTPYVRTEQDLEDFLARIDGVLSHFSGALNGRFTTLAALRQEAAPADSPAPEAAVAQTAKH